MLRLPSPPIFVGACNPVGVVNVLLIPPFTVGWTPYVVVLPRAVVTETVKPESVSIRVSANSPPPGASSLVNRPSESYENV